MSIRLGASCTREGCTKALFEDGLCRPCWNLASMFGRDPIDLASEPCRYTDFQCPAALPADAELDWDALERNASRLGISAADMFARSGK